MDQVKCNSIAEQQQMLEKTCTNRSIILHVPHMKHRIGSCCAAALRMTGVLHKIDGFMRKENSVDILKKYHKTDRKLKSWLQMSTTHTSKIMDKIAEEQESQGVAITKPKLQYTCENYRKNSKSLY